MMKGRTLVLALVVMVLFSAVRQAQAGVEPVLTVNDIFAALNTGNVDTALALFADGATATNAIRGETYSSASEIRQMLQSMQREGRRYDIVRLAMDGGTIVALVEVSDGGFVWGTETIEAVVSGGKLQAFTQKAIRLDLWRTSR